MARIYIIAIMLFVATASAAPCAKGAKYRITELETPAGAVYCYPAAINNAGVVVGGNASVVLWRNGHYTDLGKLVHETCLTCSATAINDKGTVVGWGDIGPYPESGFFAFIWKDGQAREKSELGTKMRSWAVGRCIWCPTRIYYPLASSVNFFAASN